MSATAVGFFIILIVSFENISGEYMVGSMANRTDSGLHVSDLLQILRIDRLT